MARSPSSRKRIPDRLMPVFDPDSRPSFGAVHLNGLHAKYIRTKNPLYAWAALNWCWSHGHNDVVPQWCVEYFVDASFKLNNLMPSDFSPEAGGKGRSTMGDVPPSSDMTAALGLISNGRNAFRDAWSESRSARAAVEYTDLRNAGLSAKDSLERVREWLGVSDEDQARKSYERESGCLPAKPQGR